MLRAKFAVCALIILSAVACGRPGPGGKAAAPGAPVTGPGGPGAAIRLPDTVVPLRYDIAVVPDAARMTFAGHVDIAVDVKTATRTVVLNALELSLDKAGVDNGIAAKVTIDPAAQRATFDFGRDLAPGRHTLHIDYRGVINP